VHAIAHVPQHGAARRPRSTAIDAIDRARAPSAQRAAKCPDHPRGAASVLVLRARRSVAMTATDNGPAIRICLGAKLTVTPVVRPGDNVGLQIGCTDHVGRRE